MTKNYTPVKFRIETLENRDAPKVHNMVSGGSGNSSPMSSWGEYKQTYDLKVSFGQLFQAYADPIS